ncbi:chromosome partitioning protein [Halopelagius inordinatus]|uniref:Chromosome partitioning protein n=1 Tax=Halopelagius inordinatus TaxID=553467 RepID=A0A1I2V9I0_9EURY|nr:ParA family protein [Halopelagius inordinatus]SFG84056.1 chromosome partitioning protein [Halopelagius inordinatus]
MDEPVKLCVSNQKGGVGKTTIAINVAGALNARGHDVLFVDLDPQGNATENLGLMEAYDDEPPTLFDCLTEAEKRDEIENIVREHPEMDVVPSNIDMTAAEPELTLARRSGEQLDLVLREIEATYDYVIVDCPPNLGNLMDNALFATQNVLIPALAESTSKRAFELLFDHVDALEYDYEIDIRDRAVVVNRIDVRKKQAREMVEWINAAFEDVPVWEIRERADVQKALDAGVSLLEFNPDCDMCETFLEIAANLDEQFGLTEADA